MGRSRTCDAGIFSPSLYQLSYRGIIQGTVYFRSNCLIKIAVGAFNVWRAEVVNLPSRDLLLHSRRNCPPYKKAHFFIDQRRIAPPRSSAYGFAVCAFYKMHLNSYGEFHSMTSCPESKRSLAEPMRAVWLSASFLKTGWMLRTMLTTVTNAGWRGDILKTPFQCFTSEKGEPLHRHS